MARRQPGRGCHCSVVTVLLSGRQGRSVFPITWKERAHNQFKIPYESTDRDNQTSMTLRRPLGTEPHWCGRGDVAKPAASLEEELEGHRLFCLLWPGRSRAA